jgi:hypothetical protein
MFLLARYGECPWGSGGSPEANAAAGQQALVRRYVQDFQSASKTVSGQRIGDDHGEVLTRPHHFGV